MGESPRNDSAEAPDKEQSPPLVEISWDRRRDAGSCASGPVAIAAYEDAVAAHRPDGSRLWEYRTAWPIWIFAVSRLSGHTVVVSDDGADLLVLDPEGKCTARLDTGRDPVISVDVSPDGTLVGFTTDAMDVYLMTCEGQQIWKTPVEKACSVTVPLGAGLVGVGTIDGLALLDAKGDLLWTRVLHNLSAVFSHISDDGDQIVAVGIPGCRIAVLNKEADVSAEAYRDYPAKVLAVAGRTFAVGYGLEQTDFGDPLSGCPYVELLAIGEAGESGLTSVLATRAQCFDLAPDGTLTVFGEDGMVEGWAPARSRVGVYRPLWGLNAGADCLAIASRGSKGPVFVVAVDGVTEELVFDYRSIDPRRDLAPSLHFCIQCGREYWEGETACDNCHIPLHAAGWCTECRSHYRLPAGERCPLHGTRLDHMPGR